MKMTTSDYQSVSQALDAIKPLLEKGWNDYQAAGLSPMRFRWDAVRAAKIDVCQFYTYLNDSHIDTALRTYFGHRQ